jgi:hypothetical protein
MSIGSLPMPASASEPTCWRTAGACGQSACVEVGFTPDAVFFRDRAGQIVRTSMPAWRALSDYLRATGRPSDG